MLFPVLGEANDAIAEQFRKFEAFTNSQHHGLETCKQGKKQVLVASLSILTVHLGCSKRAAGSGHTNLTLFQKREKTEGKLGRYVKGVFERMDFPRKIRRGGGGGGDGE